MATTTTVAPPFGFAPVDGGNGRACRGSSASDNSNSYYKVLSGVAAISDCQQRCAAEPGCRGIEFHTSGRCEIWTRLEGIGASIPLPDYTCQRYLNEALGSFEAVDGGIDRACRGASSGDNAAGYYTLRTGVPSQEECQGLCLAEPACAGIEYHAGRLRCEVWKRPDGIQATAMVPGHSCLRFVP